MPGNKGAQNEKNQMNVFIYVLTVDMAVTVLMASRNHFQRVEPATANALQPYSVFIRRIGRFLCIRRSKLFLIDK